MAKVDIPKEIRRAVDTGKVVFGEKESQKSILEGHAKIVVTAKNCPVRVKDKIVNAAKIGEAHLHEFSENGLELGTLCGKPFNVSVMAIEEFGKSTLAQAFKKA